MQRIAIAGAIALFGVVGQANASQILWLDANDSSTVTSTTVGSDQAVSGWKNKAPGFSNTLTASGNKRPFLVSGPNATKSISFDGLNSGDGDSLSDAAFNQSGANLTLFLVVAPRSNDGSYNGFFSAAPGGGNDYNQGMNVDQRQAATTSFDTVNFEGIKNVIGGGGDYLSKDFAFGTYHILQINYNTSSQQLVADGTAEGTTSPTNAAATVSLAQVYLGARYYGGAEQDGAHYDGNIAEVQLFDTALNGTEANAVGYALAQKYGLTTTYVPEPGAASLIALSGLTVLNRRRGR